MKKPAGMIEVDNVISLVAPLASFQNQMMTQFSNLSVNQPQSLVNLFQHAQCWSEIYESSCHSAYLCGAN